MYKVFIFDKLILLTDNPQNDKSFAGTTSILVSTKKEIKDAYSAFINNGSDRKLILYNNSDAKRLLDDFISLFWYIEAAGGLVINDKDEQLFIYRFGKWDLPKGKIERNETREDAAIREVQEETGLLEVKIIKELPSTFHIFDYKGKKVLKRTYWFEMSYTGTQPPKPQSEEDILEAKWIKHDEMDGILSNTYSSLRVLLNDL